MSNMRISKMLTLYRVSEGLRQDDVAEQIGLVHSVYCRLEHGKGLDMKNTMKLLQWLFATGDETHG